MNNMHYLVIKEKNKKTITYFEYDKLNGFNMTSKNKKINLKIKKLIDLLANIYNDGDDEDPAGTLMIALNEVEKFKRQMINKYEEYMTKEQIKLLEKKIAILEQQVTMQAYYINEKKEIVEENYESSRSR